MTAQHESILPAGWPRPKGYSNGILVSGAGKILYIAGQVGWNEREQIVSADFVDQFRQALRNIVSVLKEAGGEPASIARLTIFVTNKEEYLSRLKDVGAAYREILGKVYPAMALVQVAALVETGAKVEIEATAAW